jgi:hypothetical protein
MWVAGIMWSECVALHLTVTPRMRLSALSARASVCLNANENHSHLAEPTNLAPQLDANDSHYGSASVLVYDRTVTAP